MATLVCFHAHPDDEALSTGGLMAKASAAGHRVVLVTATRGEQGEPVEGVLRDGEALWERRVLETAESCRILGADEPIFLGYEDSGMIDTPENDNPACFWQADDDEAAERFAAILREVDADVVTVYDDHGLYGHPDHIKVHTVGHAGAKLAGVEHVFEATVNRDEAKAAFAEMAEFMPEGEDQPDPDEFGDFGVPESGLAYDVDISAHLDQKRAAMRAHASQISEQSFFLHLPDPVFAKMFGTENFALPYAPVGDGPTLVDLLPGLD